LTIKRAVSGIPGSVWVLGFVSLLMDTSSELVHSLLPLFLTGSLGLSVFAVGLIEGIAESTALITKIFSGSLSDYLGRRRGLVLLGYALGAVTKPCFALAQGAGMVVGARFVDRIGKGIRGAPRDALIADVTPPALRGAAYGLRQALDSVGAIIGPLLAIALMLWLAGNFRRVFWFAFIPGALAVGLILVGVREPEPGQRQRFSNPLRRAALRELGSRYRAIVAAGAVFTLARFSEAFLVLRAAELKVGTAWVPLVMVGMNIFYAGSAYPFGRLADQRSRRVLLAVGLVALIAADLTLAVAGSWLLLGIGIALWGLHMGMTQGLFAALVADSAPVALRGTAFGLFNLVSGIAMLVASTLAGLLWSALGSAFTFYAGAAFAAATLLALLLVKPANDVGPRRYSAKL
jgi:MFS family permease